MRSKGTKTPDALNRTHYSILRNVLWCLASTARDEGLLLICCGAAILIHVALPVLTTWLPKAVIQIITDGSSFGRLLGTVLGVTVSVALLRGGQKFLEKYIYQLKFHMNSRHLRHVALKGLTTDYCNQESGLFRQLRGEAFVCINGHTSPLTRIYDVLISLCTSALGITVFWTMLSRLHLGLIAFLVGTTVAGFFLNRRIVRWMDGHNPERIGYQQRLGYISEVSGDLRSAKDIRLYRILSWFNDVYRQDMEGLAGWCRRLSKKVFGVAGANSLLALLREGAAYGYLLWLVWNARLSVADFVLYIGVITGFSAWLEDLFAQISSLNQINLSINYFRSYLEYPETYRREDGLPVPADGLPREIRLENVSYRYEGAEEDVLQGLSLTIRPGEHIAVVGLNGAGKTTLVKLICGLIDPTRGRVLYDGVDVRDYDRGAYYKLFSAVFQQFSLLPVTMAEIVSEQPAQQTDLEQVRRCLTQAGLLERIERLPKGLDTQFGKTIYDDGAELSGGEVQRLLLARALYKSSPLLVLDEPTAALDPIAESRLYENYHQISAGKTTLFISHRLASTRFCHRILLIEQGAVREEGTHDQLWALGGAYHRLFELQAKYYREHPEESGVTP